MVNPILSKTELNRSPFARRPIAEPGTVQVFQMPDGELIVPAPPYTAGETWWKGPRRVFVVDHRPHGAVFTCRLPAAGDVLFFQATIRFTWRVVDPVEVVRGQVTDPETECETHLTRRLRTITRRHSFDQPAAAEADAADTLGRLALTLHDRGIRIEAVDVQFQVPPEHLATLDEMLAVPAEHELARIRAAHENEIQDIGRQRMAEIVGGGTAWLHAMALQQNPDGAMEVISQMQAMTAREKQSAIEAIKVLIDGGEIRVGDLDDAVAAAVDGFRTILSRHAAPSGTGPTAPPPSLGGTGGNPSDGDLVGRNPQPQRVLVGRMPAQVRDGNELSLIVHVALAAPIAPDTRSTEMRPWSIPREGSEVTLVVHAGVGLIPLGSEQQVVRVPEASDSDPVRFGFRASGIDVRNVEVTAWSGGKYLAKLFFQISVTDRGPNLEPVTKLASIDSVRPADGAVTLQVHRTGAQYTFQLHNNQCYYDPVTVAVQAEAGGLIDRALETLRRFAKDVNPPPYPAAVARGWLQSMGVSLWESMVPEAIRSQYLQLHERIETFSIATGRDDIPWELLYPMTKSHDAGFLVNQFPVTRTVYNTDRSRKINLGSARFVEAARSSMNTGAEFEAISRIVSPGAEPVVVNNLTGLLDLLAGGHAGLTHFACHATYRSDGSGAAISMSDGEFSPMMLSAVRAKESLAANRPLVFINACRSAGAVPYYTQMMGWAHQFLGAGAGAFVGTLWDVRSTSAQHFAEEFYSSLATGKTLGQAAMQARNAIMDDLDPTWLAYTVYGDPNALAYQW